MSSIETKTVLRLEIPSLRGKTPHEVYPYFVEKLGEPLSVDRYEGLVEYFYYGEAKNTIVPVQEHSDGKTDDTRWGVDLILYWGKEEDSILHRVNLSFHVLQIKAFKLARQFNLDVGAVRFLEYSWYNASDEPRYFR